MSSSGRAYIFSGATGLLVYTLDPSNPVSSGEFGRVVSAAGDVDNDLTPDFLVGARDEDSGRGRVYLFSGADGSLLRAITNTGGSGSIGERIAAAGDANSDAYDDILMGQNTFPATVQVVSGLNGTVLHTLTAPTATSIYGTSLAPLGDLNGDGRDDFAVGDYTETVDGLEGAGRVYFISGADASVLRSVVSPNAEGFDVNTFTFGSELGSRLNAAGDIDGDGITDLDVAAPSEDLYSDLDDGHIYTFSGATGEVLEVYEPAETYGSLFGTDGMVRVRGTGANRTPSLLVGMPAQGTGGQIIRFPNASITHRTFTVTGTEGWRLLADLGYETLGYQLDTLWTQGVFGGDVTAGAASVYRYDPTRVFEF